MQTHGPGSLPPGSTREAMRDAVRYWERGRLGYNLVLAAVVLAWIAITWPHFRPALTAKSGLLLLVLAAMANACYCAAYPVDLAMQASALRGAWKRWRIALWCAGTLLAVVLACYWIADEIYPSVS